jgi:hypothetical protein
MEPSINEIEKALKYVIKEDYNAGKHARDELCRIAEWQNQSVSEIHSLRDSLKVIKSDRCLDIVKRELKLAKLIYKHDLKKQMKRRRIMKLAQNLYAWSESTRSLLSGIGEKDNKGYWHKMYHVERGEKFNNIGELQDATHDISPFFILRTPFLKYGQPIELLVKEKWNWVCDAINHREGYEVYQAVFVNDAKKEMKTFFGLLKA